MLVLRRKAQQEIRIGNDIFITVVSVIDGYVKLGITAPASLNIVRTELEPKCQSTDQSSDSL